MKVPSLKIQRFIDPQIFQRHEGSYNGHIPISAIFAFVGLAASALYNYKNTIVGNEYSSNIGNAKNVNHQWSKSAEFEAMFQNYIHKFITKDINYFSLLRQFYEIRIAELFARYKNYFSIFSSCNRNFKVNEKRTSSLWCGECAKCVFVFTILSPFIAHKELVKIFGKDLFADPKLEQMFKDITGRGKMKPFDCVGTFEEASAALAAALGHAPSVAAQSLPYRSCSNSSATLQIFRHKNVCILGYGKEGKVTEQYIKKLFQNFQSQFLINRSTKIISTAKSTSTSR